MGEAEMTAEEFVLLLRGWRGSRLRVVLHSSWLGFSAFCTVLDVRNGRVAFWIGDERDNNAVDFMVADCLFGFKDVPQDKAELPVGVRVESVLGAVRLDFELLIMLLKSD